MLSKTFYDELMSVIATFPERSRQIVQRRLGFNDTCDSLETIGKSLSVTRERVRQIEAICLEVLNKNYGSNLAGKLKKSLIKRREALYLDLLEVEDEWFIGFSDQQIFLERIIERLTQYHLFEINGRKVISQINLEQWNYLKSETLASLKLQVPNKLSLKEVKQIIRQMATVHNAAELANLLYESIQDKLHFAASKGKGPKFLCSVGRGLFSILETLLVEATKPLHYTELARRCSALLGRQVEGYVHNSLKYLAYLYGRGVYGTLEHFPIDTDTKQDILIATETIIFEGLPERQWTCSELLTTLKEHQSDLPTELDKYILNIILIDSKVLKSVGRLVWVNKNATDKVRRVDLQNAVTTIIEDYGKPISTNEIKQLIVKQRGLDEYFTILPTAKIARVKPNIWGLVERDFFLNKIQRDKILNTLYRLMEKSQEGLHITELRSTLVKSGITIPTKFTDYMVMSLAQTSTKFKVRRGQILSLSAWPNGQRISVKDAIEQLACNFDTPPMTMLELRQSIEKIVKHEVKQPLHRLLEKANFVHDKYSNTWNIR